MGQALRHIRIAGRAGSGKSTRAHELMDRFARIEKHVVMIDGGETYNTGRTLSRCDLLITTTVTDGPLTTDAHL